MNNINDKLSKMLSGVDSNKLKSSVDAVSKLLSSKEGQKLKNSLSENDKKAIIDKFLSMDENTVSQKLKNVDISQVEKLSAEDIMKKLK